MNPLWSLLPPLLAIPLIIYFGERRRNLREATVISAGLVLLLINQGIYQDLMAGQVVQSGTLPLLDIAGLKLSAEPMGVIFALLASFLWVVTSVYSIGYMRGHHEKNQTRFYVCFAIAIGAVMGAAYADNLLTLFVAYEVITLSTWPLVTHAGTPAAVRAGRVYLGILMSSSIGLLLPAIVWTAMASGTMDFRVGGILGDAGLSKGALSFLLALYVFGIAKAATMPFHRWLPAAMVAPTPVSALLHAVAVVKTGVFSLLKIVTYTFGIDTVATSGANQYLLPVVAFTIIASSLVAFSKQNLKARLAYSTISQLGYIVLAAVLATSMSVAGGTLHIVMHAFAKITLFFCAGAIMVALHKSEIPDLDGIGRRMPITMGCFLIATLGIIGLPPGGAVWSKVLIAGGSLDGGTWLWAGVLMLSTLLNIGYLLPISLRAFFRPLPAGAATSSAEAPLPSLWAIVLVAAATVLLFLYPAPLMELIARIEWRL